MIMNLTSSMALIHTTDHQVLIFTTTSHSGEVSGPKEVPLEEEALLQGRLLGMKVYEGTRHILQGSGNFQGIK